MKKIGLVIGIIILFIIGMWLYSVGLKLSKVSEEEKLSQKKEAEGVITPEEKRGIKVRKTLLSPRRKVSLPSDYEPVSPEVKGIEDFAEERKMELQRKDQGIPTG